MFVLGKKHLIRRLLLVLVGFALALVGTFMIIKHVWQRANANTADGGTVTITPGTNISYGSWETNTFTISSSSGGNFAGMCADPRKSTPSGAWTADLIENESFNQQRIKLMLYMFFVNTPENQAFIDGMFQTTPDYYTRYGFVHAIVGYLNSGDTTGLSQDNLNWLSIATAQLADMISGNDSKWQGAQQYQLYTTNAGGTSYQRVMWIEKKDLGSITVNKIDGDTGSCTNTAGLSFSGTTFALVNASGTTVATKTLSGSNCSVTFEDVSLGTYTVKETSVSSGYDAGADQSVTLSGSTASVTFTNTVKKGKITVSKTDSDTKSCTPTGSLSLAGTQFTLVNSTGGSVKYNNQTYANGATIATKSIASGACSVEFDGLPYGKYTIKETATTGYTADSASKDVTLSGATASVSFSNTSIKGKVTVSKTDSKTGTCTTQGNATFNNTKFEITNNSTNAIYYGGKAIAKGAVIDTKTLTNGACSVTFENLPYGTYTIKEIAVGAGYSVNSTVKTVTIPTNNSVNVSTSYANDAILGKVTVNKIDKDTGTCTTTGDLSFDGVTFSITNNSTNPVYYGNTAYAKGAVIDTKSLANGACNVTFDGLPYGEYIIKETKTSEGYVLNTTPYTVNIPTNNSVNVSTTIANQVIRGDVKFTKMDATNNKAMQDVIFSISAIDKNNQIKETHIVVSNKDGVVNTTSSFVLHSKNTNGYDALYDEVDPIVFSGYGHWFGIDKSGKAIPVHDEVGALPYGTYIIQELRCGSNFFCTGILNQKTTITINSANQVIDLGDWDNACTKFSLGTTATDNKDGDKFIEIDKKVELKDTIEYCVKPNTDFILKGILMDKDTGEPLLINGETVEQQMPLRSSEECGTTEMIFTFDASELGGKTLVVYESLYFTNGFNTYLITEHNDIDDVEQTVDLVSLRTYATNKESGNKTLPVDADVEVKDVVTYCLRPGVEYTIKGVLMNKNTGNGLLVNSEPVESEITFTPTEACGEVEMYYKFNTTGLGGLDLVIFESLYYEDELVLEHRDINNADETVTVALPVPDTGLITMVFSSATPGVAIGLVAVIGIAGVGGFILTRRVAKSRVSFGKK